MRFATGVRSYKVYLWPPAVAPPHNDTDIRIVTPENVSDVKNFRSPRLEDTFRQFLDESRSGVYAYEDGLAVGHAWATPISCQPKTVNGYFRLEPGDTLIHYCHVAEDCRGRGIFGHMLHALVLSLMRDGPYQRILIDTEARNLASQHGIVKCGFTYLEERHVLRLGGRTIASWSG